MTITEQDYEKLKLYTTSLERDRATLWGINEELRLKIASLEAGQERLVDQIRIANPPNISTIRSHTAHRSWGISCALDCPYCNPGLAPPPDLL